MIFISISWVKLERQAVKVEEGGSEEEGQGPKAEGKAKEGTPPWGRRAKNQQRRRNLWYDESRQAKTPSHKKGRHEEVYHTTRARYIPNIRSATDAGIRLERARPGRMQGHAAAVRREARPAVRDVEAGVQPRGRGGGRAGRKGQAQAEVRRVRPVQGPGRHQRQQREQGRADARDEPDGLPLQEARARGEALPVRRRMPHER